MTYTVYWTRLAEVKLAEIYDYYETSVNSSVAKKLVNAIIDKTIGIEKNRFIGQKEPLLKKYKEEFRYLICKNYKIIYWVNSDKKRIEIATVFDTRQNPITLSKSLNP